MFYFIYLLSEIMQVRSKVIDGQRLSEALHRIPPFEWPSSWSIPLAVDIPWSVSDPVVDLDVAASSQLCCNANTETEMPVTHRDASISPVR